MQSMTRKQLFMAKYLSTKFKLDPSNSLGEVSDTLFLQNVGKFDIYLKPLISTLSHTESADIILYT